MTGYLRKRFPRRILETSSQIKPHTFTIRPTMFRQMLSSRIFSRAMSSLNKADAQGYTFPTTSDITSSPFYKLARGRTRPVLPTFNSPVEERTYRKEHLAAVFRVLAKQGHGEGISGHCSVRDTVKPDCFW